MLGRTCNFSPFAFAELPQHLVVVQTLADLADARLANRGESEPSMLKLSDYLKTAEAAAMLGVSQNTLRK